MAQTTPPTVDPLPTAPNQSQPTVFAKLMDAFLAAMVIFRNQVVALGTNVYNNAVDAYNNAVAAAQSAGTASLAAATATATANATPWVSGQTYAQGACVISPSNGYTYRRLVAGAGTTDPKNDATNWGFPAPRPFSNIVVLTTSQPWVAPAGVTVAEVCVIDGGTGGAYNSGGSGSAFRGGKGGDAGFSVVQITPGSSYTGTVGAGSASSTSPVAGGASSFSGPGVTTVTSANATLKVPGAVGRYNGSASPGDGGGTVYAGSGSVGYGCGGRGGLDNGSGGTAGQNGAIIIRY